MTKGILVDTHIWIWHLNAEPTLSPHIRNLIDTSASKNELHLSAISVWEIAMLVSKKKIAINTSCSAWINKSLSLTGVCLVPLSPEIAIESCELPGNFHGDPADRIIIASAKIENLSLISRDKKLSAYGAKHGVDIILG
jgi:PIN domain nuclease of toxin-antitoxin system